MNRFYIERLIVSGGTHEPAIIDFKCGLNFILGPSNTGKSLIMDCLDYAFGFIPKANHPSKIVDNNYGYDCITLQLATNNGTVILERKINKNKANNKISVNGSDPSIESGVYSVGKSAKKNINAVYLHLLGIDEPHSIRSSEKNSKTQELTWRSMLHLFFIRQADVARETSPFLNPKGIGITPSAATLLFLLTGTDANDITKVEDPKISEAKRTAITIYIKDRLKELNNRQKELEEYLASENNIDSKISLDFIKKGIAELQSKLNSATKESQEIMSKIFELNEKLSESKALEYNFSILHQQYQSDIKRIGFIVDGASIIPTKQKVKCPICGEETERIFDTHFIESSAIELDKIKHHLSELSDAEKGIKRQQEGILKEIHELEKEKENIDTLISSQLQPQLSQFEEKLEQQLKFMQLAKELEVVKQDEERYRNDLFKTETSDVFAPEKHRIIEDYTYEIINGFEEKLKEMLKASKINGAETARLDMKTFDIEIDGFKKSVSMGGGYCGILNTISTLAMSAYLIENDRPAPGFFAVDSSLTQLSEAKHKGDGETIKQNFINYLISHALERQVIIIEQTKRMPYIPPEDEAHGVHIIQFTKNKYEGRYGFLNDVHDPGEE